jgi:hypothetical protein
MEDLMVDDIQELAMVEDFNMVNMVNMVNMAFKDSEEATHNNRLATINLVVDILEALMVLTMASDLTSVVAELTESTHTIREALAMDSKTMDSVDSKDSVTVSPSSTQQVKMLQEMERKRSKNRQNNKRYSDCHSLHRRGFNSDQA